MLAAPKVSIPAGAAGAGLGQMASPSNAAPENHSTGSEGALSRAGVPDGVSWASGDEEIGDTW